MAVPVCNLLSHPKDFVGHRVTVGGLYANDPHRRILFDQSCPSSYLEIQIADGQNSLQVDCKMQRLLEKHPTVGIRAVYSGVVTSTELIAGCADDGCFLYRMLGATLVSAEWR
jgi:hypothetical protein